jgi:HSP20 family protein
MAMRDLIRGGRRNEVSTPRYEDTSPFVSLHRQMNRLFDDFFRDFDLPAMRPAWSSNGGWPNVELEDTDKEYRITAELPGLDDKDIDVSLREGVLTLKGEKRSESSGDRNGGRYSERWFGKFERSFDLGADVDADRVSAAFKKGLLTITVGKRPESPSRIKRIPVSRET